MKNTYFAFLLFAFMLFSVPSVMGQNSKNQNPPEESISGLAIYPNPVNSSSQSFITIQSKLNSDKIIEFYDVLGKRIFSTELKGKELNISNLSKGVYILKITENKVSEARKLVIK
ncbi:T9SS type A sorting domain-containing protein [Tamlana flava]|uniref:T9SS type A sorting domain-containing protein n=1 Tax=Tamlana flava TaxID=3158572 RepID=UPI00351B29F2